MDERQHIFLGLLAGGGFGAILGGVFGAMVGAVAWKDGRAAGTPMGLRVARAWGEELPLGTKGAIVGGVDGFVFLGALSLLLSGLGAWQGHLSWEVARPTGLVAVGLILTAALFGLLAQGMIRSGTRAVAFAFVGSALAATVGFGLAQVTWF